MASISLESLSNLKPTICEYCGSVFSLPFFTWYSESLYKLNNCKNCGAPIPHEEYETGKWIGYPFPMAERRINDT